MIFFIILVFFLNSVFKYSFFIIYFTGWNVCTRFGRLFLFRLRKGFILEFSWKTLVCFVVFVTVRVLAINVECFIGCGWREAGL